MSELTYYVAASLDGFIAHQDGSFGGFAQDDDMVADFVSELAGFGTVLMGRKTYDIGRKEGTTSPYPTMRQIVFSRTIMASPDPAVELVRDNVVAFVRALKSSTEAPIWLCGGSEIAALLRDAGLVDHVVVKLNPRIFGDGIPLFAKGALAAAGTPTELRLTATKAYQSGIVVMTYQVVQPGPTSEPGPTSKPGPARK